MKKILALVMCLVIFMTISACGGSKPDEITIPDVFGVNYADAIGILEAEGFEVSAVEVSVGSFSDKLLYPLEKVEKGSVFKVDEYIIDNNGHLNKNYDVFYDGGLVSTDKSIVIYYAKEDYVLEADSTSESTPNTTQPPTEFSEEEAETPTEELNESDTIDPEFKDAMDSYEAFFDEYIAIMKKYKENPTDLSILSDYASYIEEYAEMMQEFENWENEDLNAAEVLYYTEVQSRITKKLLELT